MGERRGYTVGYFYGVLLRDFQPNVDPIIKALPAIPVERGNHHITILYIGEKPPNNEAETRVAQVVESTQCFTVLTGRLVLLPSTSKPRVIAIEVRNIERLARLRAQILNAMRDSGVKVSDEYLGDFKPHITIAYIRSKVDPQYLVDAINEAGQEERAILIDRVSLIRARENTYMEITIHRMQCP